MNVTSLTAYCTSLRALAIGPLLLLAGTACAQDYRFIQNRWKKDQYLNVEQGRIAAGKVQPGWHSAMWTLERIEGTQYFRFRNRWKSEQFLHVQNGTLQSGPIESGWWSAMWTLETADENSRRIRNRWKPEQFLHIENGRIESGPIESGWWSANWFFPRVQ